MEDNRSYETMTWQLDWSQNNPTAMEEKKPPLSARNARRLQKKLAGLKPKQVNFDS